MQIRHFIIHTLYRRLVFFSVVCGISLITAQFAAYGQAPSDSDSSANPSTVLNSEQIQAKLDALATNSELSEAERKQAETWYQQVLDALQEVQTATDSSTRYQQAIIEAPPETEQLQQRLRQPTDPLLTLPRADAEFKILEEHLIAEQAERGNLRKQLENLDQQLTLQRTRPETARKELATAQQKRLDLDQQQATTITDGNTILQEAQRIALSAQHLAVTRRIASLEQELASYEVRLALANAQRALTAQQINASDARIAELQRRINDLRRQETEIVARETATANAEAKSQPKIIRDAANENLRLSDSLTTLINTLDRINARQKSLTDQLQQIEKRYQSIQQQLAIAGLNDELGPVLRQERRSLPNIKEYQRDLQQRREQIVDTRLKQFRIDEQRHQLTAIDKFIDQHLKDSKIEPTQVTPLRAELRRLLNDRIGLLDKLSDGYTNYIRQLATIDNSQQLLVQTAQNYAVLLDENLFWIASAGPMDLSWVGRFMTAASALAIRPLQYDNLSSLLQSLWPPPFWLLLVAFACIYLNRLRRTLRRHLKAMVSHIGKVTKDRFFYTVEAVVITILLILPWPVLIACLSAVLIIQSDSNELIEAIGYGFYGVAFFAIFILSLHQICRPQGLALIHLGWPESSCQLLRRHLRWFLIVGMACAFVVAATEAHSVELYRNTLGRTAFIVGAMLLTILLIRLLHPRKGVFEGLTSYSRIVWLVRYIWRPLFIVTPIILIGIAALGYYYTALQLLSRFFMSLCLLVATALILGLILRWLRVEQRRLAWVQARAKREAMLAARNKDKDNEASDGEAIPQPSENEFLDLDAISEQTRGLLHLLTLILVALGLWWIWADLLPALTFLNKIVLWQQAVDTETGKILDSITLGNLVLSLALFILILFVARNLPGLLEVAVLQRFAIDAGNRYAITTMIGYTITIIGVLIALNTIGVSWDKAQWLVAALGVGLGFGLQEIFANFVSGIILLLERPVRVGNTVTLGNLTGTVTRIRIRATTITDFDNKEIIVPNKTFITESLTNWNLSEPVTRVIVPVRVAYGSDTDLVYRLLVDIAESHPLVLKEPAAMVLLMSFGDNALQYEVRVFVRELLDRLTVTHELHATIHHALRENNIEIPFPQRDLHIRSLDDSLKSEKE